MRDEPVHPAATDRQVAPIVPVTAAASSPSWILELPFTRPLSLNDRMNHWAKAARTRTWRDSTAMLAYQQRIPRCRRIAVQLMYTPGDSRRRDALNLVASLKACEDGLVDARVIPDDSTAYHTSLMPQITEKGPPRRGGNRLWLVITEL